MKTIYKFNLDTVGRSDHLLPRGYIIRSLCVQHETPVVYIEVDDRIPLTQKVEFTCYCTGEGIPTLPGEYLGTVLLSNGNFVQHIYFKEIVE